MKLFRTTLFVLGGTCWLLGALVFGALLFQYLAQGAGLQFILFPVSSGSILFGLVHVVGLMTAIAFCFAVGTGLCAHGLVPPVSNPRRLATRCDVTPRLETDTSSNFTLRFAEIGRTLEYNDLYFTFHFPFAVGSEDKSIVLKHYVPQAPFEPRYQIAFERTKDYFQSLGFRVEVSGAK